MLPVVGGLISGLASVFGTEQNNAQSAANVASQNQANAANQLQAESFDTASVNQQEAYNTQMSNTAYQRASADMTAAGLNPAAMFGSGSAASTPSISAPTIAPVQAQRPTYSSPVSNIGDVISKTVSNAVDVKTMDKMTDEIANLRATNDKIVAETATEKQRPSLVAGQASDADAHAAGLWAGMPNILNSAKTSSNQMALPDWLRTAADDASFMGKSADNALSPISSIISSAKGVKNLFDDSGYFK